MYFVYELVDPRTDVTGYIGITNNPNYRYYQHIEGREGRGKKHDWIQRLQEQQTQPKMKILEIVDDLEQAQKQERYWIQHYISKGIELKNTILYDKENEVTKVLASTQKGTRNGAYLDEDKSIREKNVAAENEDQAILINGQLYYTASQAQAKLGLSSAEFHGKISQKLIPKVTRLWKKQGFYPKRDIDALASLGANALLS